MQTNCKKMNMLCHTMHKSIYKLKRKILHLHNSKEGNHHVLKNYSTQWLINQKFHHVKCPV